MAQLADLLFVILLLLAVVRQFPRITALLGHVFGPPDAARHPRDTADERQTIDLVLCEQCRTTSPLAAQFCADCGARLPRYVR